MPPSQQVEALLALPGQPNERYAEWLNLIAAWQLRHKPRRGGRPEILQQVIEEFPETPQASHARRRLGQLDLREQMRDSQPPKAPPIRIRIDTRHPLAAASMTRRADAAPPFTPRSRTAGSDNPACRRPHGAVRPRFPESRPSAPTTRTQASSRFFLIWGDSLRETIERGVEWLESASGRAAATRVRRRAREDTRAGSRNALSISAASPLPTRASTESTTPQSGTSGFDRVILNDGRSRLAELRRQMAQDDLLEHEFEQLDPTVAFDQPCSVALNCSNSSGAQMPQRRQREVDERQPGAGGHGRKRLGKQRNRPFGNGRCRAPLASCLELRGPASIPRNSAASCKSARRRRAARARRYSHFPAANPRSCSA